jgi:hypothetical protein
MVKSMSEIVMEKVKTSQTFSGMVYQNFVIINKMIICSLEENKDTINDLIKNVLCEKNFALEVSKGLEEKISDRILNLIIE